MLMLFATIIQDSTDNSERAWVADGLDPLTAYFFYVDILSWANPVDFVKALEIIWVAGTGPYPWADFSSRR